MYLTYIQLALIVVICLVAGFAIGFVTDIRFANFKEVQNAWKPIYENRRESFDCYLKEALYICNENDPIEIIAGVAALNKFHDTNDSSINLDKLKEYYMYELRSANIG